MALGKMLQIATDATTAAVTEEDKTTALVNGVIDATFDALSSLSPISPGQQQALAVLKADALTNVADIQVAIFGEGV